MMSKSNFYIALIITVLLFNACKEKVITPQDKISRNWKYTEMKLGDDQFPASRLGYPTMEFRVDSTYTVNINDLAEDGSWFITGDTLFTTSSSDMSQKMQINLLTMDSMVLEGISQDIPMILIMVADTTKKR